MGVIFIDRRDHDDTIGVVGVEMGYHIDAGAVGQLQVDQRQLRCAGVQSLKRLLEGRCSRERYAGKSFAGSLSQPLL